MRHLTKAQQKLIEKYFQKTNDAVLDDEISDKIAAINDYETVYSDAQRYLNDLVTAKRFKTHEL